MDTQEGGVEEQEAECPLQGPVPTLPLGPDPRLQHCCPQAPQEAPQEAHCTQELERVA